MTHRDRDVLRHQLTAWLATKLHADVVPTISELRVPEGTGMSSETLLFDASWHGSDGGVAGGSYVVRMEPAADRFW